MPGRSLMCILKLRHKAKPSDHKWNTVVHRETFCCVRSVAFLLTILNNMPRYWPILLCWPLIASLCDWPPPCFSKSWVSLNLFTKASWVSLFSSPCSQNHHYQNRLPSLKWMGRPGFSPYCHIWSVHSLTVVCTEVLLNRVVMASGS